MTTNSKVNALLDYACTFMNEACNFRDMFNSDFRKGRLPDVSYRKVLEAEAFSAEVKRRIDVLMREELDHYDRMSLKVLEFYAEANFFIGGCENPSYGEYFHLNPAITPNNTVLSYMNTLAEKKITTPEEARNYVRILQQYPELVSNLHERTRQQAEKGIYLTRDELGLTLNMLSALCQSPVSNPLWLTEEKLSGIECPKKKYCEVANFSLEEAITELSSLMEFLLSDAYQRNVPDTYGLCHQPSGTAYYERLIQFHCDQEMTAEKLYAFGMKHLEELEEECRSFRRTMGFGCDHEAFIKKIETMEEFYETTAEGIAHRYEYHLQRIQKRLPAYFAQLAKAPCRVERLQPENEASMAMGYFSAATEKGGTGKYMYNGSAPETQNQIISASTIFHELLPGHHFQMSLTLENQKLHPIFRSMPYLTGYGEGWAEYASYLAKEMGMYESPWDEYGNLMRSLRLTVQLLIDVGVNALGWTKEQATKMFKQYTGWSDTAVFSEMNRFANDIPGQGSSYVYCCMKIRQLREKAETSLGERFDLKEFHRIVLELGAIPMHVLQEHVDWYIEQKLRK